MATDNELHTRAARLAEQRLPDYLGNWISGVLTETHALPALIQHQNKIATDVLALFTSQQPEPGEYACPTTT